MLIYPAHTFVKKETDSFNPFIGRLGNTLPSVYPGHYGNRHHISINLFNNYIGKYLTEELFKNLVLCRGACSLRVQFINGERCTIPYDIEITLNEDSTIQDIEF